MVRLAWVAYLILYLHEAFFAVGKLDIAHEHVLHATYRSFSRLVWFSGDD